MSPANLGSPVRPGASELVVIAGRAEPLDVPEGPPLVVPVALFDAEPETDPVADSVADAVSACDDPVAKPAVADPPEDGDALLLEPGSLGSPCEATLEAKRRVARHKYIRKLCDRNESRMVADLIYFL